MPAWIPTWYVIGTLAGVCAVIAKVVWGAVQVAREDALPETSVEARVAKIGGRFNSVMLGKLDMFDSGGNRHFINLNREYYVTFELLSDCTLKKFAIPVVVSPEINEGDTGVLTFQGRRFILFTPQNKMF